MRPQSCKSKGRRLQQSVARSILDAFPDLGDGDAVSTSMGAGGEDIRMSPAARERVPLSIECKNVEKINVWGCLEQATKNTPAGASPCLVFTRNRSPVWAVVPWDLLIDLFRRARNAGCDAPLPPRLEELILELSAFARHPQGTAEHLERGRTEEMEVEVEEGERETIASPDVHCSEDEIPDGAP